MRNPERGASGLMVFGVILTLIGLAAIVAAPQVMNSSEINTLRGIGAGVAALGAILAAVGSKKKS